MSDLITATKNQIIARLDGNVGAPVFDHVPDGHQPPVVILDRIDSEPLDVKGGAGLTRALLTINVIARGRSRDAFRLIVSQVVDELQGWRPADTADVSFSEVAVSAISETTLPDGLTHLSDITAELFVQPA